jgi:pimeloyl-ACP methyl ester carboxylesterase
MEKIQQNTVVVNGIRMHYATAGQGPLLLLLHGFPEFWYSWLPQVRTFRSHFTVVAPDLRGYNDTDKPGWGYEIDVILADIIEYIRLSGHPRAIVAGHGLGGLLAWALAILYPHRVDRLVVLNTPHPAMILNATNTEWNQHIASLLFAVLKLPWLPEMVLGARDYALVAWILRNTLVKRDSLSDEDIELYKDAASKPGSLTAMLNWYRFARSPGAIRHGYPLEGLFKGNNMHVVAPTLLIWGEQHLDGDISLLHGTEQYVPNLCVRYLSNCSHRVLQEQPEQVNRSMADFLL